MTYKTAISNFCWNEQEIKVKDKEYFCTFTNNNFKRLIHYHTDAGSTGCTKSISTSSGSSTSRTLDGRGFYGNYSRAIRGSNVSSARSGIRGSCVSRALVGSAMRNISDDSNLYPCPPGSPVGKGSISE